MSQNKPMYSRNGSTEHDNRLELALQMTEYWNISKLGNASILALADNKGILKVHWDEKPSKEQARTMENVWEFFGEYNVVHTIPNAIMTTGSVEIPLSARQNA